MTPHRLVILALAATACSAPQALPDLPEPPLPTRVVAPAPPEPISEPTQPSWRFDEAEIDSTLVVTGGSIDVYDGPDVGSLLTTLPETTILGTPTVLTVVDRPVDGWVEVILPVRPNGSTGFVRLESVELYVVDGEIVVDLSDRELVYYEGGEEILRTDVAVGSDRNPTPTGRFFVTDTVTLSDASSPWGPHALGLSARSDTITEYNGGDGIIGIHGTNNPASIGQAASLGCVRLPNEMITLLHSLVPVGTPVEIRA